MTQLDMTMMGHPAAALFAFLANRLRAIEANRKTQVSADTWIRETAERNAERNRLPPPDESFYWACPTQPHR